MQEFNYNEYANKQAIKDMLDTSNSAVNESILCKKVLPNVEIQRINCCTIKTEDGTYLQSYKSIVALRKNDGSIILFPKWNYSRTTAKHVSQFLNIRTKEILQRIKKGEIKVWDGVQH